MNEQTDSLVEKTYEHVEEAFVQAPLLAPIKSVAQQNLTAQKEFCYEAASFAKRSGNAVMELVDTTWATQKILNKKMLDNITANTEAAITAAQSASSAQSFADLIKVQSDYVLKNAEQTREQATDLMDLWGRALENAFDQSLKTLTKSSG